MSQILYQLAYRNIKKYKKHYLFVGIIVMILSMIFMSVMTGYNNHYEIEKRYKQKIYGTWYAYAIIPSEDLEINIQFSNKFGYRYSVLANQGFDEQGNAIAHVDQNFYEMCSIQLKEGRYPKADNEVMISDKLLEDYKLNESISFSMNGQEKQEFTIVGIVHNSQDNIFPEIYTFIEEGLEYKLFSETNIWDTISVRNFFGGYVPYEVVINEHGYDANVNLGMFALTSSLTVVFVEILLFLIIGLISITSTSLNRRTKEFALLRGIGMTNKQLLIMVLYENMMTVMIGLVIGTILSFGVVYLYVLYCQTIYHEFVYQIYPLQIIFYFIVLLICIGISTMFPIHSSAKRSLSGTFDANTFQYIQVRYRKLKKQTPIRLAIRELRVFKKLTLSLLVFMALISSYIVTIYFSPINSSHMKTQWESFHYLSYSINPKNYKDALKIPDSVIYRYKWIDSENNISYMEQENLILDRIVSIDDSSILDRMIIKGKRPTKSGEILIYDEGVSLAKIYTINDDEIDTEHIKNLDISDHFFINGKEFTVVGIVKPNEISTSFKNTTILDYIHGPVYMLKDDFDILKGEIEYLGRTYFDQYEDNEKIKAELLKYDYIDDLWFSDDALSYDVSYGFDEFKIEPYMLVLPSIMGCIFCYFLSKNDIYNHAQNYALLKLVGMTNRDLMKKQFFKSLIITGILFVIIMSVKTMVNITSEIMSYPLFELMLMMLVIFVICVVIYCLPLYQLLKEDKMSILYGNE